MGRLKIIGVEEHGWTAGIRDALQALPPERRDRSVELFNGGETDRRLRDFGDGRIADMDAMGMDMAVLSITTPATQILDAPEAVRLSREANDILAAAVRRRPDRLSAFATVPMPDPAAAVDELERAVTELGLTGVMIHGRTGDRTLDHPDFAPILDKAGALGIPVQIHPQIPAKSIREAYYEGFPDDVSLMLATGGWGWHMEAAISAIRLMLSGTFERNPDLQVILGHWGEMIPFYLERLDAAMSLSKRHPHRVGDLFRRHFYVAPSGIWSLPMLTHAIGTMGADRILFAIDYPFQLPLGGEARRFLEQAPISPSDKEKIGHGNIERLLGGLQQAIAPTEEAAALATSG